jgi:hypothetical protein
LTGQAAACRQLQEEVPNNPNARKTGQGQSQDRQEETGHEEEKVIPGYCSVIPAQ